MRLSRRPFLAGLALAATLGLAGCASTPSGPPKDVSVIVFPGGFNWPIWAAQEKGFFERNGVKVNVTPTPNSTFQLTGLITGKFDIAMTAIDNLVAYRESQGEAPMIGHDLVAVMGGDNGFLRLVSTPDVKSIADLRGKTVSVDARTTGYAFVLFDVLERGGLKEPAFSVERAGGVLQRFQALMDQKHAATLLITPFEVQAQARGFNVLADGSQAVGRYQGLVAGVRQSWADRNPEIVRGYIRGYAQGVEWLYDPANRAEALAIFTKNVQNATPQQAETAYRVLLDPKNGFQRRAQIDLTGVKTVLDLRSKWSAEKKPLTNVNKYYDPKFYDRAVRGL
jgi:ABC-type nitrate/sulfonate/bicarbonate transport system substrate-binding protein